MKKPNKIVNTIKKVADAIKTGLSTSAELYDYSTPENREVTAITLFNYAKMERNPWVNKWKKYDDYYRGQHQTALEIANTCAKSDIPFIPACVQDPYMHVESQIVPDIPDFEFYGRDDDIDNDRAKQREYVVQFVLDNNKIESMNPNNERRLNKLGNALWKIYWDNEWNSCPGAIGDIRIADIDPANIFPDPAAYDIEDCEYIFYSYRMHIRKAIRVFGEDLKELDIDVKSLGGYGNYSDTQIYNSRKHNVNDDTVQVTEFWYKDDDGDIACSILINQKEVRFVEKYWENTKDQNKSYPFVKYCKIADENNFWDTSEMENIIDLVDAADREMSYGLLNSAFTSNDLIITEEGALADGQIISNTPGQVITAKQGMGGAIRRLGGLTSMLNRTQTIEFFQSQIQETIGNFDVSMGKEPVSVTTASGIAQINERSDLRKSIKKADRLTGFERLYELIDWTALEFYDDNRMIFLHAPDNGLKKTLLAQYQQEVQQAQQDGKPAPQQSEALKSAMPVLFSFNSQNVRISKTTVDPENPDVTNINYYYPRIDAKVWASNSLEKSKAYTTLMLQQLINMPITIQNYKLVESLVDLLNLADKKDIKSYIEDFFQHAPIGIPKTTLNFKDLPPEGKVELAQKIGLDIQTPPAADSQNVPYSMLVQGAPPSGSNQPTVITTQNQQFSPELAAQLDRIIGNGDGVLSPEELQHLKEHPEILEEMLKGGQPNG